MTELLSLKEFDHIKAFLRRRLRIDAPQGPAQPRTMSSNTPYDSVEAAFDSEIVDHAHAPMDEIHHGALGHR